MSGNYQSRVFTFVSRSANQLKDSCAKGLRHLKVAVVWSGQILLYPLHLLAQATKIFQPQLPPPRQQPLLATQPVPDINIEQALELVEIAGYPILFQRGFANEIAQNRSITVDCYRSDALHLNSTIGGQIEASQNKWQPVRANLELAQNGLLTVDRSVAEPTLWYRANGSTAVESQENAAPRSYQVTAPKPTIRGLSSLLSDRQLVLVTTENEILDLLTIAQQQEIRRRIGLDIALAWHQWHTSKISGARDAKNFNGSQQLFLTDEPNFREIPPQNLFERLTNWFKKDSRIHAPSSSFQLKDSQSNKQKSQGRLSPNQYPFIHQPSKFQRLSDLPQLPPINETDRITDRDNSIGEILAKLRPNWVDRLWSYYRDYVYIPAPTGGEIVYQPPQEFELIPIDPKPSKIYSNSIDRRETTHKLRQQTKLAKKALQNLEHQPDWIEVISEEIGYSQTPFARFLAWLDRIVLAIENWLIELWNKIGNSRSAMRSKIGSSNSGIR